MLRGAPGPGERTRQRVLKAAAGLSYRPDRTAGALADRRAGCSASWSMCTAPSAPSCSSPSVPSWSSICTPPPRRSGTTSS
ncbi:hypothetical protein [Streptomyces fuscichromogenes]|uniref:hypothetical protein n=1 Tax=Streptomyces fuscichromogenes TaxID=1324013 RepID=UPI001E439276|nr:hypothetical protein [Streptomyces fuscichromogenes]